MREAIGGSKLLLIIVTLIIVIMMLLAGSIGYSKAFKARNAILNIVQKNGAYGKNVHDVLSSSEEEVVALLNEMGYKTNIGVNRACTERNNENKYVDYEVVKDTNYNFCIYRYIDLDGNQYYGIETYMYFELPLFGKNDRFVFPIYGDSYTFFKYGN